MPAPQEPVMLKQHGWFFYCRDYQRPSLNKDNRRGYAKCVRPLPAPGFARMPSVAPPAHANLYQKTGLPLSIYNNCSFNYRNLLS
jgi:hypothetical protein